MTFNSVVTVLTKIPVVDLTCGKGIIILDDAFITPVVAEVVAIVTILVLAIAMLDDVALVGTGKVGVIVMPSVGVTMAERFPVRLTDTLVAL